MLNTPFSPWPSFTEDEIEVVRQVLQSNKVNYWTGEQGKKFEEEFAAWVGCNHAIALANGTVALDLALYALGIGAGNEVVVTSRTFLASVSSVVNAGAVPVFADVDAASQNITAETIRAVLSPRTRAIICVHLAGFPCEMDEIMALAEERDLYVIEDCAQAHGARYKGRSVGTIGHVGAWSFCQDKIMTTGGEGGMVTTNDHALWSKMWSYKDHGKSFDAVHNTQHPPGFRWVHESFGTNWRLTEMQSAIGRVQLGYMPAWHEARKRNAEKIMAAASQCPALRVPSVPDYVEHAWYKVYIFVKPELLREGWSRDRVMNEINDSGAPCYMGSCSEVYLEKAFDNTGWRPETRLPVAQELGETSLMFLAHPTLSEAEIAKTCDVIQAVMQDASIAKLAIAQPDVCQVGDGHNQRYGGCIMSKAIYPTFGLREMSWPKGDGYLYLALPGELEGRPIANFDLYKTTKEELRQILKEILPTILAREKIPYYELKNFSPASELVFHEVAAELGLVSAATSAKVAIELRPAA